jgi:serine/threonine protein kinase
MPVPGEYVEAFARKGFRLVSDIGSGLSGTVFRATQESLARDVAIKVFDNPIGSADMNLRKRFVREAQLLARVSHPSIPVVLTRGTITVAHKEVPYTAMQLIDGINLATVIEAERRLPYRKAVEIVAQVLAALSASHTARIVHRDVKPANIMVHPTSGHVWLIDFSIGVSLVGAPGLTRVTAADGQPGTVDYMAPEQRAGAEAEPRADLYSVGVSLFEMLAGHTRLNIDTIDADLAQVPVALRELIRTACQAEPAKRFENAEAFGRALSPLRTELRIREQPGAALCRNFKCPRAQWTERGYYEGPSVLPSTTDNCCEACGTNLVYPCERCGRPFGGSQFCGDCGSKLYEVPQCQQCGSWLTAADMDADTAANGCERCRRAKNSYFDVADGDVPF